MIYAKSIVAGILAVFLVLAVWLIAINIQLPSTPLPPSVPPPPAPPLDASDLSNPGPVVFDFVSTTWTSVPDWPVLSGAVLIFACGFLWEFRRASNRPSAG